MSNYYTAGLLLGGRSIGMVYVYKSIALDTDYITI